MITNIYQRLGKRILDVFLATGLLLAVCPIVPLIIIAIKIDTDGSVLFKQPRVGRSVQMFQILKFRTMTMRPDRPCTDITVAGDARVTRVGKVLRRTKLDELPQLWNVIRGDMSIVGPRPEIEKFVRELYSASDQAIIFRIRPGLTDPATIVLLSEDRLLAQYADAQLYYVTELLPKKIRAYRCYAMNVSFLYDMSIIALTFWNMACEIADSLRRNSARSK